MFGLGNFITSIMGSIANQVANQIGGGLGNQLGGIGLPSSSSSSVSDLLNRVQLTNLSSQISLDALNQYRKMF